jgi:Na+/H+ antiporter NhaD/arsenite permease-like protein
VLPTLVVFALTYVLIAGRRLSVLPIGRPAGALLGAVGMVIIGLFDPEHGLGTHEAFAAIDADTIGLLFGMMVMAAGVADAGLFERAARLVEARRPSPAVLIWLVTIASGLASALLLNDSVCLLFAPLVDRLTRSLRLPRVPYLLALAMGANAGSALTLAGNPQNMLVAQLSGISYRSYLVSAGPAALVGLVVTAAVLHALVRRELPARLAPIEPESRPAASFEAPTSPDSVTVPWIERKPTIAPLVVLLLVSVAFVAGADLAWTAIAGAAIVITWRRRDATPLFADVSWTVLIFFAALFIVVAGLEKAGVPAMLFEPVLAAMPREGLPSVLALSGALLVGCQIISNVPFILLVEPLVHAMPDPVLAWKVVALVSTLAGNLTLLGSVANIIVIETVGAEQEVGFRRYLRVGAPVTLASLVASLAILWLMH